MDQSKSLTTLTIAGRELSRRLMNLPARERLNAILDSPDAEALLAALAPQDFYFTVQEIGHEDALPLLALASMEQINHLFDVEWWVKDAVQPVKAAEWIDRLARADDSRFLAWLHQMDFELLVTLFKKWIIVAVAKEDEDPLEVRERLPANTLDDTYHWEVRYPQYEDFIRNLLGLLFEVNQGFYRELMNHILYALDVEVEEDAYRFHRGRMEDNAIPDFYDALEIYRPITRWRTLEKESHRLREEDDLPAPSFALALIHESDLLGKVLSELQDVGVRNALQLELAALSNKVMVADQLAPDNVESFKSAVEKATAGVNLGLELCSSGVRRDARRCLGEIMLEDLFRYGHSQALRLQRHLKKEVEKGWLSQWPSGLHGLDIPWREQAELLLRGTPRLPRSVSKEGHVLGSGFLRSREDLRLASRFIRMVKALEPLHKAFPVPWQQLEAVLWADGQVRDLEDVTLGTLVLTAAARFISGGMWAPVPLEVKTWNEVFPVLNASALGGAIRTWRKTIVADPAQGDLVDGYLQPLLAGYEEEMGKFSKEAPPEPQYVRFFLFSD